MAMITEAVTGAVVLKVPNYIFMSYSRAALRTTRTEPTLWTRAPVTGFNSPRTLRVIAMKLSTYDSCRHSML